MLNYSVAELRFIFLCWRCVKNEGSALRAEIFQIYQKSFSLHISTLICEIWSDLYDFSPKGRLNFYFDTPSFCVIL